MSIFAEQLLLEVVLFDLISYVYQFDMFCLDTVASFITDLSHQLADISGVACFESLFSFR